MLVSHGQAGELWGDGITYAMIEAGVAAFEKAMPGDLYEFWMGPPEDVVQSVWLAMLQVAPKSSLQNPRPELSELAQKYKT